MRHSFLDEFLQEAILKLPTFKQHSLGNLLRALGAIGEGHKGGRARGAIGEGHKGGRARGQGNRHSWGREERGAIGEGHRGGGARGAIGGGRRRCAGQGGRGAGAGARGAIGEGHGCCRRAKEQGTELSCGREERRAIGDGWLQRARGQGNTHSWGGGERGAIGEGHRGGSGSGGGRGVLCAQLSPCRKLLFCRQPVSFNTSFALRLPSAARPKLEQQTDLSSTPAFVVPQRCLAVMGRRVEEGMSGFTGIVASNCVWGLAMLG